MALTPTDKLLAAYIAFVTVVLVVRGPFVPAVHVWVLVMHALFVGLWMLLTRQGARGPTGRALHGLYPILVLVPLYTAIGYVNDAVGLDSILRNDAIVQRWEAAVFGGQVSYGWIRTYPSVFWSGLLHIAYLFYYPAILGGPLLVTLRHGVEVAKPVIFSAMLAYLSCYVVFILFPVAGPNYAFPHPTGVVREVWSAELVYGILGKGSSVGAAFPSSHVAATVAVVWGIWRAWRGFGALLLLPTGLLTIATVYCQMHYGMDAAVGLAVGVAAGAAGQWLWAWWSDAAPADTTVESPVSSASLPRTSRR